MPMYQMLKWDTSNHGPMTESAIREIHGAPAKARVSKYVYSPGDKFEGTSKASTAYVLEGRVTFSSHEGTASFVAGDVFVFSGGNYSVKVDLSSGATVVWAWELPPEFWVTN